MSEEDLQDVEGEVAYRFFLSQSGDAVLKLVDASWSQSERGSPKSAACTQVRPPPLHLTITRKPLTPVALLSSAPHSLPHLGLPLARRTQKDEGRSLAG